ncbi:hypothetical protein FV232_04660 [Methylobacterium sp. WL30]|nr:hypothetical protein FV223_11290 [Methylobacterium sp. WL116]TXN41578.1 hypothetical protein FV225_02065 [Methylobacterium sp. WL93]TXN52562.1 hypothetical protein FV227_03120 [Methylobacterium sp. WL119]TXN69782.1 hypothetical protein FV232_04660 [Methylobacterium sp. WL30]
MHETGRLVGIGLYTPAEAGRLLSIRPAKISRWLRGHDANGKHYDPLWSPQVDLGEEGTFLGFRDLQEVRVASTFIEKGMSAQRVRQAIELAREVVGEARPLSTTKFRSDGHTVFLRVVEEDGQTRLIDLFRKQFAFEAVIERSLTNLEYDEEGIPSVWWPLGKAKSVKIDPTRSFGQPIEAETSVPVDVLVSAAVAEGSPERAARAWDVPVRAVKRALAYRREMDLRQAA